MSVVAVVAGEGHAHGSSVSLEIAIAGIALIAVAVYVGGAVVSRRRGRPWPAYRTALWCAGIAVATASVIGPLAAAGARDFVVHMWGHVLIGMLAPLLLVLSTPVTLALRSLSATPARRVSRVLRSRPVRVVGHPLTALLLSAGGLWLVYLTPVFAAMRTDPLVHLVVSAHLLVAGFVFTAAVIGRDPTPHRPSRVLIAGVLVAAMASHAVLAKYLYAHPPAAVDPGQAREGAQVMYYAGAWIEAAIVVIFCSQWYRAAGRRGVVPSASFRT